MADLNWRARSGVFLAARVLPAVLLALLLLAGGCGETARANGDESIRIHIGGVPLEVEVVASPSARQRGLMYRAELEPNHGMLFVFPDTEQRSFWMKNCLIPLDVGFFDERPFLLNVETMQPDDGVGRWNSRGPARYAVETNAGWYERNLIRRGARLELPNPIEAY